MKYILRTLWVIGLIPVFLLGVVSFFIYLVIGLPILAAFFIIQTGKIEADDIFMPYTPAEWLLGKYNGLLDKIK